MIQQVFVLWSANRLKNDRIPSQVVWPSQNLNHNFVKSMPHPTMQSNSHDENMNTVQRPVYIQWVENESRSGHNIGYISIFVDMQANPTLTLHVKPSISTHSGWLWSHFLLTPGTATSQDCFLKQRFQRKAPLFQRTDWVRRSKWWSGRQIYGRSQSAHSK